MKFKVMDHEAIYLAGVVHYGPLNKGGYRLNLGKKPLELHIEGDEEFQKGLEDLRTNASRLREQLKEEVKFHKDHFSNDYKDHRRQWKSGFEAHSQTENKDQTKSTGSSGQESYGFESLVNGLGSALEKFGRYMEENSGKWEANMKDWGKNFEQNMDAWGDDFGKHMDAWGKAYESQWDGHGKVDGNTSIKDYPIYETFEAIFDQHIKGLADHIKQETFYEVQILDVAFDNSESMTMIGSRMASLASVTYPVATMTFKPDKWVGVKLSLDEYKQDWLASLERTEQLKGYVIEPYFIVRHKEGQNLEEVRVFCPISEKQDER